MKRFIALSPFSAVSLVLAGVLLEGKSAAGVLLGLAVLIAVFEEARTGVMPNGSWVRRFGVWRRRQ